MAVLFETITNDIVGAIKAGAVSYTMPWNSARSVGLPVNAVTTRPYRGINVLLLWAAAARSGYAAGEWATCRQWSALGAQVRKGESGSTVVLWKPRPIIEADDGSGTTSIVSRTFHVFNAAQVDGYDPLVVPALEDGHRIATAESYFASLPVTIHEGGDAACYDPASDIISIPSFQRFRSPAHYYSVLAHELTHWSGAKKRLDRDLYGRFGSEAYAMEELIAELGAAFVTARLSIETVPRANHAGYIETWLRVLGRDSRAIITAASKAEVAADYLLSGGAIGPWLEACYP